MGLRRIAPWFAISLTGLMAALLPNERAAAQLFNPYLQDLLVEDLKRFKYNIEGGVNYVRGEESDGR